MNREDSILQIYLVGGAVRDRLLGFPVEERDWVVVGATPVEMIAQGFQPVGKEFPVFLHPETHEEYALARTERKIGKGYKGFIFYADPSVTLEQDLKRRDLTINAIAEDADGRCIDPFSGQDDLHKKLFRHVSDAFQEDPVRILRVARLATKLIDFHVHPKTQQLMRNMVNAGEVDALVAERVWQEFQRALANPASARFFTVLHQCGALETLFPAIHFNSQGLQQLGQAPKTFMPWVRFALLLHDVPSTEIRRMVQRYKIPNQYSELALLVSQHLERFKTLNPHQPEELLDILMRSDALRRSERFSEFLKIAELVFPNLLQKTQLLKQSLVCISTVDTAQLQLEGVIGSAFAERLKKLRLEALQTLCRTT